MTARVLCMVKHCSYVAESAFADFQVCALHDSPKVLAILEDLRMPSKLYPTEPFLIFPGFALCEDDLVPRPAPPGAIRAEECPRLAEAATQRRTSIQPEYNLLVE